MAAERPLVDIIIVDYNAGAVLDRCLNSVAANPPEYARIGNVIVVDNASTPPTSIQLIDASLPLTIIRNDQNRGFAAACNQGARGSSADFLLFLNPDTELLPGSLDVPARFLKQSENQHVGVAGVQLLSTDGGVARSCSYHPRPAFFLNKALGLDRLSPSRFPSGMMLEWDHATNRQVDAVMGAFYFVRRTLFERLSGFDERFFVYFEENDFSYRASNLGYATIFLADARAYHSGCGTTEKVRAHRLTYSMRSRLEYARVHFSRSGQALVLLVTMVVEPFARMINALAHRSTVEMRETLHGYKMLWGAQDG